MTTYKQHWRIIDLNAFLKKYLDFCRSMDLKVRRLLVTNILWVVYIFVRVRKIYGFDIVEIGDILGPLIMAFVTLFLMFVLIFFLIEKQSEKSMPIFFGANWIGSISSGFFLGFLLTWLISYFRMIF